MNGTRFKELLVELISLGHEMQGIECKSPGPRTDRLQQTKVIKAMLGMTNRRDGGLILIGIKDIKGKLDPVGLSAEDLSTWKYDDIASSASEYADPSIVFEVQSHEWNGKHFILITVKEFADIPVICKKTYGPDLRQGGCYIRSRRKPETTEIPTQEDMRDLLDLATEKRVRNFIAQVRSVGLDLTSEPKPSDDVLFDQELGDFYRG